MKPIYLRDARLRAGLTQQQLKAISGVSQTVISKLERGAIQDPALSSVLKLAKALRRDPRALRFGPRMESVA